jgi:uncharacterized membrane protein YvbJ
MVFCYKCGANVADDANFCSSCGISLKDFEKEEFKVESEDLVKTVKQIIHEGNVRRIIIKDEKGKILLDIPVTIGVIGIVLAPWLAALGAIGAIATKCTIIVEKRKK